MKSSIKMRNAFTLIELLVVVVVLVILSILIYPGGAADKRKSMRLSCVNNLKQIDLAYRIYSEGNRNCYPINISTNSQARLDENTPALSYFSLVQNKLETPKVLICPADKQRTIATSFTNLNRNNLSYFIGLDANENPNAILVGDRNITNGFTPKDNVLYLTTNQPVGFTEEIHKEQGNIAMGDGSVQQVSNARLKDFISNTGLATNRILLP